MTGITEDKTWAIWTELQSIHMLQYMYKHYVRI